MCRKPTVNWALKVNRSFISILLHLNWVFLGALACDCVKNWTQTHLGQCHCIFYSYSSETTDEVGTLMSALGVLSPFAGLGEGPRDPLHLTLLTFLLSSSVATPSEAAQ